MEKRIALMGLTRRTSDGQDVGVVIEEQGGLQAGVCRQTSLGGVNWQ